MKYILLWFQNNGEVSPNCRISPRCSPEQFMKQLLRRSIAECFLRRWSIKRRYRGSRWMDYFGSRTDINRCARLRLRRPEQRFGVGVVVWQPWPREPPEHTQFLQTALQRDCTHGVSVVGMENQGWLPAYTDPFSQASPTHQIHCNGWILTLIHIPGHDIVPPARWPAVRYAAPDVDHQVEVKPDPAHGGGQIGDVPTPNLVYCWRTQTKNWSGHLGRRGGLTGKSV